MPTPEMFQTITQGNVCNILGTNKPMSTVDFTKLGLTKEVPSQLLVFLRPLVVRQNQNFWRTGVLPVSNAGKQISIDISREAA
jgi:hypothetical protein